MAQQLEAGHASAGFARADNTLRSVKMWAPLIGIGAGWAAAVAFGIYDFGPAAAAPPVGLPLDGWPRLGLDVGLTFWSLLPTFLFLSVVAVLQSNSIGLSIQQVSWRRPRAMDYRRVQGVGVGSGLGNLLAGLASVMPIATAPRGTAFVQQTGCASRDIGLLTGALLVVAAFSRSHGACWSASSAP